MVAFPFRMGAGAPGTVTRTHPASIFPYLNDGTSPVAFYGAPCMFNGASNDVRAVAAGDASSTAVQIAGIVVRPFPQQAATSSGNFGAAGLGNATPPSGSPIDVLKSGSIIVPLNIGSAAPQTGGAVYVWAAATSGNHIQGGFESAATGGSTMLLDTKTYFNGPADSSGNVEVCFNL